MVPKTSRWTRIPKPRAWSFSHSHGAHRYGPVTAARRRVGKAGGRPIASSSLVADLPETGRAEVAYDYVFKLFQSQIAAAARDRSLTPAQRAAAIATLRRRQIMEARGAQKQVVDEERQNAQARRRLARSLCAKQHSPNI